MTMSNKTDVRGRQHRRRIRLRGYDYSHPGAYFLTICKHKYGSAFGEILDGKMKLNECGHIISACWHNLPEYHPHVTLNAFIVMPNHVHVIVVINRVDSESAPVGSGEQRSLFEIVRVFKTSSSRRINKVRGTVGSPVWQRSYWEHIIRNQEEFNRIHEYIIANPRRWHLDRENPDRTGEDDFDHWLST